MSDDSDDSSSSDSSNCESDSSSDEQDSRSEQSEQPISGNFSDSNAQSADISVNNDLSPEPVYSASNTALPQPSWMTSNTEEQQGLGDARCQSIRDIIREAVSHPDLYGVRRSSRPRSVQQPSSMYEGSDDDENEPTSFGHNRVTRNETLSDFSDDQSESNNSGSDYSNEHRKPTRGTGRGGRRRGVPRRRPNTGTRRTTQSRSAVVYADSSSSGENNEADSASDQSSYSSDDGIDYRRTKWLNKRSVTQAVSYKEQSEGSTDADDIVDASEQADDVQSQDESDAETIEKVIRHRIGRKGATGSQTVAYVAENEGDPNDGFDPATDESEVQYYIKWKNWAHIHNTWESEAGLREQKVNGIKRLENYKKKEEMFSNWRKHANPEEQEYLACQQEMDEDLHNQYCQVERVIRCKTTRNDLGDLVTDYLVKWQGLPYSCATEEDGNLIDRLFPRVVDEYNSRLRATCTPNKLCRALKVRPKFVLLKDQPPYLGGEDNMQLRDYQLDGLNWLLNSWCKENSVILADEMGLGKTIQTISFIAALMNIHGVYGPFLILVPLSTLPTWLREFRLWAPQINVVEYIGDVTSRSIIRAEEWCHPGNKKLKFNVLITTYEILLKDKSILSSISWAVLGVDEAHRLKNDDSLLYKSLFTFDTNHRLLITGTPLQNSLKELWALLHFLMPKKYERWEEFEQKHVSADTTGFQHLHAELQPFLLRRVKKDVEKSLPAKVEQILRVEMSNVQKKYYKLILTKNYKELTKGSKSSVTSFVNLVMELKKCCNHAFLVRQPDDSESRSKSRIELIVKSSGKLILLDKLLLRLKEAGHRVLIFSQMVRMLDILAEYLQLRRFCYQRLDGSIRGELRKQAMDHFNAEYSPDFCFLLSTRAGGLGVNLATADTVIIFDSDWNPQNDLQAQARAHRIGQKNQVSVYRLVTKNSVEEDILERAKKKMVLDHLVIQRMDTTGRTVLNVGGLAGQSSTSTAFNKDELTAILKFGAEELFKESDDDDDLQVDIDDILRGAEQRTAEELRNSATDELLSQFKVVSFDNLEDEELEDHNRVVGKSWDEIIPEVERRKIEDEELHQQLLALNPPPRSRKTINQSNSGRTDTTASKRSSRSGKDSSVDDDDDDDDDDSDRQTKKRGRPKTANEVKGFTNTELKRFLRSMKKFGRPRDRLDDIACDAELQEKSKASLVRLVDLVLERCQQTMTSYEAQATGGTRQPPTFKLSKVTVNAKLMLQSVNELEPLVVWMSDLSTDHSRLPDGLHVKDARFDCAWTDADDASLLRGIYKYGTGSWDSIHMDADLNLSQILPDRDLKPQAKHLQTRFEYLLRVLKKHFEKATEPAKPAKVTKPKASKSRAAAAAAAKDSSDALALQSTGNGLPEDSVTASSVATPGDDTKTPTEPATTKKHKSAKTSKTKRPPNDKLKKSTADNAEKLKKQPFHFTTNETQPVADSTSDLLPEVFAQCKEKMRPVKKALKQLGNPDPSSGPEQHLEHTRRCLLKIGDHINHLLDTFSNPDHMKDWRNNLWLFVSKFTDLTPSRLHKVYKHMARKRSEQKSSTCEGHSRDGHFAAGSHADVDGDSQHYKAQDASSSERGREKDSYMNGSKVGHQGPPTSGPGSQPRPNRETELSCADKWRHDSPLARDELSWNRHDDSTSGYNRRPNYSHNDRQYYDQNRHTDSPDDRHSNTTNSRYGGAPDSRSGSHHAYRWSGSSRSDENLHSSNDRKRSSGYSDYGRHSSKQQRLSAVDDSAQSSPCSTPPPPSSRHR